MAKYPKSDTDIRNFQEALFQNKDELNQFAGVNVVEKEIGNHTTGKVDGIIGGGTSSIMSSLLVAAQLDADKPLSMEINAENIALLKEFLDTKTSMSDTQIAAVEKAFQKTMNTPALAEAYKGFNKTDPEVMKKAHEATINTPAPTDIKVKPEQKNDEGGPKEKFTGPMMYAGRGMTRVAPGDQEFALDIGRENIEQSPLPQTGVAMSTIKPGAFVDERGNIVDTKPVHEEYGIDGLVSTHKPTVVTPIKPNLKGDDMMIASHKPVTTNPIPEKADDELVYPHQMIAKAAREKTGTEEQPVSIHQMVQNAAKETIEGGQDPLTGQGPLLASIGPIGNLFKGSSDKDNHTPRNVSKDQDYNLTLKEARKMAEESPTAENQTVLAIIEQKNSARLAEVKQQIEELIKENAEHRESLGPAHVALKKTAKSLDMERDRWSEQPFQFKAVVDGEERTFELTLNQIMDGDFGGIDKSTILGNFFGADQKRVTDAANYAYKYQTDNETPLEFKITVGENIYSLNLSMKQIHSDEFIAGLSPQDRAFFLENHRTIADSALKELESRGLERDPNQPFRLEVVMHTKEQEFTATREQIEAGFIGDTPMSQRQQMILKEAADRALAEFDAKSEGAPKKPDQEIVFKAPVHEVRHFHQSIAEIRNGDFGGLYFYEMGAKDAVITAGLEQFRKNMMAQPGYPENIALYKEQLEGLVGKQKADEMPTSDFQNHLIQKNVLMHTEGGQHYIDMKGLYALENEAWKLEKGISRQVYEVSQSEIDAHSTGQSSPMLAKTDADPTSPSNI